MNLMRKYSKKALENKAITCYRQENQNKFIFCSSHFFLSRNFTDKTMAGEKSRKTELPWHNKAKLDEGITVASLNRANTDAAAQSISSLNVIEISSPGRYASVGRAR